MVGRDALFEADTRRVGDSLVVSLSGELDMATASELEQAVSGAPKGSAVIVDMRRLTFIDSEGVRALLAVYAAGNDGLASVRFVEGPDAVQRVLRILGVDQVLAWTQLPEESDEAI